jgi:hypothetical protein
MLRRFKASTSREFEWSDGRRVVTGGLRAPCRCTFFRKSPEWVVRSQLPQAKAGWTPARKNINPAGGLGGDVGKRWANGGARPTGVLARRVESGNRIVRRAVLPHVHELDGTAVEIRTAVGCRSGWIG